MAKLVNLTDKSDIVAEIRKMLDAHERGELGCVAMRICKADGTVEEIVLNAESDEQHDQALQELRESFRRSLN